MDTLELLRKALNIKHTFIGSSDRLRQQKRRNQKEALDAMSALEDIETGMKEEEGIRVENDNKAEAGNILNQLNNLQ